MKIDEKNKPVARTAMPKFSGTVKETDEQISPDNTVFILEREYGITCAEDERPVLMTAGILGYGRNGCTGILLYDPRCKVGSLAHLPHHKSFSKTVGKMLDHMEMYGGRRFQGYIIRPTENPNIEQQLDATQRRLQDDGLLIDPFELFPEQTVIFDTRDGKFSKRPSGLYLRSIEDRPYGNRIIREGNVVYTNPAIMSCCYEPFHD